ncbi:hypothetical protein GDO81_025151 [Engystomops pustulosus]|uniref:Uncharacterized protein n=1 Tax=Engystomops pustulosus TaxID=76066 RepID=A0AAV6YQG1_ENGPU|nr:hypothetical protein GDO81_025151 [Engystomops pustulosus]
MSYCITYANVMHIYYICRQGRSVHKQIYRPWCKEWITDMTPRLSYCTVWFNGVSNQLLYLEYTCPCLSLTPTQVPVSRTMGGLSLQIN